MADVFLLFFCLFVFSDDFSDGNVSKGSVEVRNGPCFFFFFFVYKRKQLMDIVTIVVDDDVVYLACSGPTLRA